MAKRYLSAGLLMLSVMCSLAFSQGFQGTIRGTVEDQTGAVLPGANVTLTNVATGEVRTQLSNETGTFLFPNLLISTYRVEVEMDGFKKYTRENVQVKANQIVEVGARLEVGAITESVSVIAGADIVQTSTSQLEGISLREVANIPSATLKGDPINLAILAPGTTTQSGGVVGEGGSIGGNRPRMNNFVIDGVDNNDPSVTGSLTPVIQDAVEEFTLLTNQFSAEYGHSTAGQFITTMRSGANAYHGRAWWYNQNRHTNALDNIQRAITPPGGEKPRFDWNRFGGQVGGPIIRDKWFFFGSYEYRNLTLAGSPSGIILVPTGAGLSTLQSLANTPGTGVSPVSVGIITNNVPTASVATGTAMVMNELTGQMVTIPVGQFSATTPNFEREQVFHVNSDIQTARHRFSVRYNYSREREIEPGELPVDQFNSSQVFDTQRATFADVFTAGPRFVNEFRAGWNRAISDSPVDLPGAPGSTDVFGNYSINDLSLFIGPQSNFPQGGLDNIYQFSNTSTTISGDHTFKFGAEMRNIISSSDFLPRARGDFVYTDLDEFVRDQFPSATSIRGVGKGDFAQNRAAFYAFVQDSWRIHPNVTMELGLRYEYTQVARDSALQDLNGIANIVSITEEVYTPELVGANSPLLGTKIFDSLPARHQQALLSHVGHSLIFRKPNADRNNFAPRIGLAWDVFGDGRTSLRAGAGIAHDVVFGNLPLLQMPPQVQAENRETNACILNPAPSWCAQVGAGQNPRTADIRHSTTGFLSGGGLLPALPAGTSINRFTARAATGGFVIDDKVPEVYTWTLSLQHEPLNDWLVEGRYVGNHGINLPVQRWKSAGVPNPHRLPVFVNESEALATNFAGRSSLADFTGARNLLLLPYGFGGVLTQFTPDGQSWYHGGSVALKKRFSQGFQVDTNYTWSKTIDVIENDLFTSFLNPRRPADHLDIFESKGLSGLHHEHKFVVNWTWAIPGPASSSGAMNNVFGGWQIAGNYIAESGQPITLISRRDVNGDFDTAGDRVFENGAGRGNTGTDVNFVCWNGSAASISPTAGGCGGSANIVGYSAQDPNARYIRPGTGGQTNMGRNTFESPGINTWNLSLYKDTEIREDTELQFRIEMWNAFNHPNFTIGHGSVFATTKNSTGLPGYATPGTNQFLDKTIFSGGLGQAPFQRVIQWGVKLLF